MKHLIKLALIAVLLSPVKVAAQLTTSLTFECGAGAAGAEPANLHGNWDFLMDVAGTPNFGQLSIGFVGSEYGGSLALWQTAPVVLRKLVAAGNRFHMAVASPAGDVLFDGTLSPAADRVCGTVTYHDGRKFAAVAQKRPSAYRSLHPSQRAPAQ